MQPSTTTNDAEGNPPEMSNQQATDATVAQENGQEFTGQSTSDVNEIEMNSQAFSMVRALGTENAVAEVMNDAASGRVSALDDLFAEETSEETLEETSGGGGELNSEAAASLRGKLLQLCRFHRSTDAGLRSGLGTRREADGMIQLDLSRAEAQFLVKAIDLLGGSATANDATVNPNDLTFISRASNAGGSSRRGVSSSSSPAGMERVEGAGKERAEGKEEEGKREEEEEEGDDGNEELGKIDKRESGMRQPGVGAGKAQATEDDRFTTTQKGKRRRLKTRGEEEENWEEEEEEVEFMDIHPDIRGKIFSYLPIPDLARVALVCSSFAQEIRHPRIWRHISVTNKQQENATQIALQENLTIPEVICARTLQLNSIALLGGVDLTEHWVTLLASFHATLTHLTLHVTLTNVALDDSLMSLAVCCENLTYFEFRDKTIGRIPRFTAFGFRTALGVMQKLENLAVHVHNWIDNAISDELLLPLTSKPLKRVCLEDQRSELTEVAITTLSHFKCLAHLELRRCHLDESSVSTIRQMKNLESLELLFVRGWQLSTWLQLFGPPSEGGAGLSRLKRLGIPVYLGDDGLSLLPGACGAKLENLVMHGIELFNDFRSCFCETVENRLTFSFRKPTNEGIFTVLEGCPRLEHLGILMNNASKDYSNVDFNFALGEFLDRRIECRLKEFRFEHAEDRTSPIFLPIRTTRDGTRPETKYSSIFLTKMIRNLGKAFGHSLERLVVKEVRSNIASAGSHDGWVSLDRLLESLQHLNKLTCLDLSGFDIRMRTEEDEETTFSRRSHLSSSAPNEQQRRHSIRSSLDVSRIAASSPASAAANAAYAATAAATFAAAAVNAASAASTSTTAAVNATDSTAAAFPIGLSPPPSPAMTRVSTAAAYRELIRWKLKTGTLSKVEIANCNIQIVMTSNPLKEKLKDTLDSRAMILIDEQNSYHVAYDDCLRAGGLAAELIYGRADGVGTPRRLIQNEEEEEDWNFFAFDRFH